MGEFSTDKTDTVSSNWVNMDHNARLSAINSAVAGTSFQDCLRFTKALDTGAVYAILLRPLGPGDRGAILLDAEEFLKKKVDQGINIWCEPIGDRNSLRNLRGVQINRQDN